MPIRYVISDIDGTLVDSVDLHAEAWRETFEMFGNRVPAAQIRAQIGKGGDQLLPVFWRAQDLEKIEGRLSNYRSSLFKERYLPQVKAFAGVRELFQRLRQEGKQIALASSAKGDELEAYKEITQIGDLIQAQTSSDDADKSKPHPDIFQAALAQLGNPSGEECVVLGDTPYDIESAKLAGLRTIALRCGGFPERSLKGAIAIYDSPADLLAQYASSPLAG